MEKNEETFLGKNLSESELFCQNSIWQLVEKSAKDFDISPNKMMQIMMDISIGICVMCDDPRALLRAIINDFENFEASPAIERMVQHVKNEREKYNKYKDGECVD